MAHRVRELKDGLTQATEINKTLREERRTYRETVVSLYTGLVRYKPEFTANATSLEDTQFPDLQAADLTKYTLPELMGRIAQAFSAVSEAVTANREEVKAMYHELDVEADAALDAWRDAKAQDQAERKAETFRKDTISEAAKTRVQTPDLMADPAVNIRGPALPPTPPHSTDPKERKPDAKTSSKPTIDKTTKVGDIPTLKSPKTPGANTPIGTKTKK